MSTVAPLYFAVTWSTSAASTTAIPLTTAAFVAGFTLLAAALRHVYGFLTAPLLLAVLWVGVLNFFAML